MKDFIYYNELFVIYKDLLTEKEKETFEYYYQEDLSLSEIADNKNISRAAVQKMIKNVTDKLDYYEKIIHKYEIINKLRNISLLDNISEAKKIISEIIDSEN